MKKMCALLLALVLVFNLCACGVSEEKLMAKIESTFMSAEEEAIFCNMAEFDPQHYYYKQLSDFEKQLYERLVANEERFIENEEFLWFSVDEIENTAFNVQSINRAFLAYLYDTPMSSMWIRKYDVELLENEVWITIPEKVAHFGAFDSPDNTRKRIKEVEETAQQIVQTLSGTDEEKLRQIYSVISSEAFFADDELFEEGECPEYTHTVWSCINGTGKIAVCEGFARSYKYLADLAGLNTIMVCGSAKIEDFFSAYEKAKKEMNFIDSLFGEEFYVSSNHAWIYVWDEANGWTLCDPTKEAHFYQKIEEQGSLEESEIHYETSYISFMVDISEDLKDGVHIPNLLFKYPKN